jgi:hypothetical protein
MQRQRLWAVSCNTLNLGLNSDYDVKGIGYSEIKLGLGVAAHGPMSVKEDKSYVMV